LTTEWGETATTAKTTVKWGQGAGLGRGESKDEDEGNLQLI